MNTALIVEPRSLQHTVPILNHFANMLDWEFIFYCGKDTKKIWEKELDKKYELRELDVNNFTPDLYNDFLKQKKLWESMRGEFVLVFQLDTWIMDDTYTIDYFIKLNKSYIGGNMSYPWHELTREKIEFQYNNFNGGLSLRKRLDMIKVIDTFPPQKTVHPSHQHATDAEDVYFTLGCHFLNLPIGNDEPSSHFATHTIMTDSFGIHQPCISIASDVSKRHPSLYKLNPHLKLPYKKKIAIFNGFTFHYEMFGYIIHYCKTMDYDLTIYCHSCWDMKWLAFYYSMYMFECKDVNSFHNNYDYIFLTTDDDPYYRGDVKTICIDHFYKIRSPQYSKRITTRPFDERPYVIPVYPIVHDKKSNGATVLIIGHSDQYDIPSINRLTSDKPIIIQVISRNVNVDSFQGCKYPVKGYSSVSAFEMMDIIYQADYIMTDVACSKNYVHENMSGAIPLALSTLTPLIISKETNTYYQFKYCIEYDDSEIILQEIDVNLLRKERDEIIERNHKVLQTILS